MNVPCTWSRGSVRFFSAGMYFNTTVSSPLYCMVQSILLSTYTIIIHNYKEEGGEDNNEMLVVVSTLGCRVYQSSIWESNSQESKVSSTSPRKLLCPKRSWCHTESCRVRVSSCEWLITYCTGTTGASLFKMFEFSNLKSQNTVVSIYPQILIEDRVDGVGLDARLPLALS